MAKKAGDASSAPAGLCARGQVTRISLKYSSTGLCVYFCHVATFP